MDSSCQKLVVVQRKFVGRMSGIRVGLIWGELRSIDHTRQLQTTSPKQGEVPVPRYLAYKDTKPGATSLFMISVPALQLDPPRLTKVWAESVTSTAPTRPSSPAADNEHIAGSTTTQRFTAQDWTDAIDTLLLLSKPRPVNITSQTPPIEVHPKTKPCKHRAILRRTFSLAATTSTFHARLRNNHSQQDSKKSRTPTSKRIALQHT
ncbi:hypothetical protein N657DRAFT_222137 [Parathielavia appendiculata]|uniref:Uncharacterized protein n=1 Tax=Parathielavia appendiculata TaxID=2587402 RepID=A0AAN6U753_9PEZI|nr:hypothetical protein N657DRAFT_222137 [Parathielavia appendiculata]